MSTYRELLFHLKSHMKARREYMRERRWFGDEWYEAWERGLADEVVFATREFNAQR